MLQCLFDPIQVQPALMRDIYVCEKPTELYVFWVWPYLLKYSLMRVRRGDVDCGNMKTDSL